jgi:two-component system chemotaxis response regulator CheB
VAGNGKIGLAKIGHLKPDMVTLDIEMPVMTGIEMLEVVQQAGLEVGVLVLSTLTRRGGALTLRAMELGAFDYVTKPEGGSPQESAEFLRGELEPRIRAFMERRRVAHCLTPGARPAPRPTTRSAASAQATRATFAGAEAVGIGVSTGGPVALAKVLPGLPGNLAAPVLVVQHMPPEFTGPLATSLDAKCSLEVREATDGEVLRPGTVRIAPGGKQMKVVAAADGLNRVLRVTDDPPENNCKPAVDYLFRSLAQLYAGRSAGVVLTGMGHDGTAGAKLMSSAGCHIIAQDEATSVVFGMPRGVIDAGIADTVAPLEQVAAEIVRSAARG